MKSWQAHAHALTLSNTFIRQDAGIDRFELRGWSHITFGIPGWTSTPEFALRSAEAEAKEKGRRRGVRRVTCGPQLRGSFCCGERWKGDGGWREGGRGRGRERDIGRERAFLPSRGVQDGRWGLAEPP